MKAPTKSSVKSKQLSSSPKKYLESFTSANKSVPKQKVKASKKL